MGRERGGGGGCNYGINPYVFSKFLIPKARFLICFENLKFLNLKSPNTARIAWPTGQAFLREAAEYRFFCDCGLLDLLMAICGSLRPWFVFDRFMHLKSFSESMNFWNTYNFICLLINEGYCLERRTFLRKHFSSFEILIPNWIHKPRVYMTSDTKLNACNLINI